MKIVNLLSCAILLISFSSFRIFSPDLETVPHKGSNTLACTVNNFPVVANDRFQEEMPNSPGVKYGYSPNNNLIFIGAIFASPRYDVEISFKYPGTPGVYPIELSYPYYGAFFDYNKTLENKPYNSYHTDATHKGTVTVYYNDDNIISGTFTLDAVNSLGNEIHIKNGKFDISKNGATDTIENPQAYLAKNY